MNKVKEFADLREFLEKNKNEIIAVNTGFWDLFVECGEIGDEKTSNLRQFTFLFSFLMTLVKTSGMPKKVKLELIELLKKAVKENKV